MTPSSQIRRIALIVLTGCAILAGWTSTAAARPIDDGLLYAPTAASTAEPRTSSSDGDDRSLPIVLAGVVVVVAAGTAGYAYRTRTSRRAIA